MGSRRPWVRYVFNSGVVFRFSSSRKAALDCLGKGREIQKAIRGVGKDSFRMRKGEILEEYIKTQLWLGPVHGKDTRRSDRLGLLMSSELNYIFNNYHYIFPPIV